jgi:hypothetical protein
MDNTFWGKYRNTSGRSIDNTLKKVKLSSYRPGRALGIPGG